MTRHFQLCIPLYPCSWHFEFQTPWGKVEYDQCLLARLLFCVLDPDHSLVVVLVEHGELAIGKQVGMSLADNDELFVEGEYARRVVQLSLDVDRCVTRIHLLPRRSFRTRESTISSTRPLHGHPSVIPSVQLQALSSSLYCGWIVPVRLVDPSPPVDALRVHIVFDRISQGRIDDPELLALVDEWRARLCQEVESQQFAGCDSMFRGIRSVSGDTPSAIVLQRSKPGIQPLGQ